MKALISAGFSEGHAYPALALARGLRARGNEVAVQLSARWRGPVEELGATFLPAEPHAPIGAQRGPGHPRTLTDAALDLAERARRWTPDLIVADLVAPAAPLAAELAGIPWASLVPTLYPVPRPGLPPFSSGFTRPRTSAGRVWWRVAARVARVARPADRWLQQVPTGLAPVRAELGLKPLLPSTPITTYGPLSTGLTLVATFPQLEDPVALPKSVRIIGPLVYERPEPPVDSAGDRPLVVIAPSTVGEPDLALLERAMVGLESMPVRVLVSLNRRGESWDGPLPENATVVDWLAYGPAMDAAAVVICTGGHGTVARALVSGTPLLVCPKGADTQENGARVSATGAGLTLPRRLLRPQSVRLAVSELIARPRYVRRARELRSWARAHDAPARGAELLERYAGKASSAASEEPR